MDTLLYFLFGFRPRICAAFTSVRRFGINRAECPLVHIEHLVISMTICTSRICEHENVAYEQWSNDAPGGHPSRQLTRIDDDHGTTAGDARHRDDAVLPLECRSPRFSVILSASRSLPPIFDG